MRSVSLPEPPRVAPPPGEVGTPLVPTTHGRRSGGWWSLAAFFLLALAFIAVAAFNCRREIAAADRLETLLRHAATGGAAGACDAFAQTQPPAQFDPDALCWVNLTQRQWQQGSWRPHDFPFDNAPAGRERHWSSSLSWWLLCTGMVTHLLTGQPMEAAIAQGALGANPALFVLFLGVAGLLLRRRLDAWPTGILLVTLAAGWHVEWDFSYGRSDHHGLHLIAFTGMLLAALVAGLGWVQGEAGEPAAGASPVDRFLVRPGTARHARFWFAVSGACGGAGLWIGSTQQCFGVAALGIGATLGALCFGRTLGEARLDPRLWRRWARVGAVTSLGFYLLEYFPSHLEMRLEVNHPLMALTWLGAGEVMCVLMEAWLDWPGTRARWRQTCLRACLGGLAMSALPLAVVLGPKAWWVVSDPITTRTLRTIAECQPWLQGGEWHAILRQGWNYTGALLLTLPLALWALAFRRQLPPWRRMAMLTGLVTATVFLGWSLAQIRWIGFLECALPVLAVLVAPCLPPVVSKRTALPLALLALTVPGWLGYASLQATEAAAPFVQARSVLHAMMANRELAWNLRLLSPGQETVRVMSPFLDSPRLHYYNPAVQTVGSFYWENIRGCRTTIDFFNDAGDQTAQRIAREHGLDFILVQCQPTFVMQMQMYQTGYVDPDTLPRTLAYRLANPVHAQPPDWLEPVPLVEAPVAVQEGYRLYQVRRDRL